MINVFINKKLKHFKGRCRQNKIIYLKRKMSYIRLELNMIKQKCKLNRLNILYNVNRNPFKCINLCYLTN